MKRSDLFWQGRIAFEAASKTGLIRVKSSRGGRVLKKKEVMRGKNSREKRIPLVSSLSFFKVLFDVLQEQAPEFREVVNLETALSS